MGGSGPRTVFKISKFDPDDFVPETCGRNAIFLMRDGRGRFDRARCRSLLAIIAITVLRARTGAACRRLGHLALFDELFVLRAALDHLERALFLDYLGRAAREVALAADGAHEARALHASAEFTNGRKRAFAAAF